MSLKDRLANALRGLAKILSTTNSESHSEPLVSHYDYLESAYLNTGLYERLAARAREGTEERKGLTALRSLRNPANRVVEFYAAKIRPEGWFDEDSGSGRVEYGDEATARAENLTRALRQVEEASNWGQEGRVAVRQYAWAGDLFLKVSHRERDGVASRVYRERIDPRHVVDFDKDERGYFTYLQISVPKTRRSETGGETESYVQTEVWDKTAGVYLVYEHDENCVELREVDLVERLALSESATGTSESDGYTGYDFIPVTHAKFRDIGAPRGMSAFGHALEGIRESDRIATKLHDMLFPEVMWVMTRQPGPGGESLPPIQLESSPDGPDRVFTRMTAGRETREGVVEVGGKQMLRLPGGADAKALIPDQDMEAHAGALAEQVKEVERELPELAYSRIRELELSGRAIRYAMMDVLDRYEEAFTNFAESMARLNYMALTIGQVLGLPGFSEAEIGSYGEDGRDFEHRFVSGDIFPPSRREKADEDLAEANVHATWREVGGEPYRRFLLTRGYTEEEAVAEVRSAAAGLERDGRRLTDLLLAPDEQGIR